MSSALPPASIINCAAYAADGTRRDIPIEAISDVLAVDDGSWVWVGLYEPGAQVLDTLQEEFGLHDLAVEDAQNAHQRPKIEGYGDSLFIAVHTAQSVEGRIRFGETHVFAGPRYIVTVRHGASASYAPARARLERERDLLVHGPGAALYAVLDLVVDNYAPIVDEFNRMLLDLEKLIFAEAFSRDTVHQLYALKRELTRLRMAVAPMQDIVGHLARARGPLFDEEVQLYMRDVLDHAVRIDASTETLREMLTTAVSVNLSLVTVQQGEVVKRLGAWAALLAAPTLIASWYGMNFEHMPELHGRWSYATLIGVVALISAGLYWKFKKARWL
ncbi:magnesium and cobalt transport protein CorA [Lysobacter sp. N42]|uniref:magnesium and cobalt transport protein CorA n=1 Tax=Lysobacter sp. N42 TaxID=2545719 RepID=UPI00104D7313|nr:magnesium and cobalt transport protein CorA [Lysobacter sp. N42]TCZ88632.1 magnesium and cobalt transport protein CorA [Lysobacter sp. N42]